MLNKCDSSSRIISFACLLTNFCWVFFLCQASPSSENAKFHHERPKNPPAFSGACCTCLYSWLDPDMAFPFTGGGGKATAHLGQGLWQMGGDEHWPGIAGGNLFPCQSSSFATARCEWSRLFPNPDSWETPETCTSKPRFFGQTSSSGSKLLLCKFCKALLEFGSFLYLSELSQRVFWVDFFLGLGIIWEWRQDASKRAVTKCKKKQWKMRRQRS